MTTPEEEVELRLRRHMAVHNHPIVQRAAARLVVSADESLGQDTPQWIRDLAARDAETLPTDALPRVTAAGRGRPWSRWWRRGTR